MAKKIRLLLILITLVSVLTITGIAIFLYYHSQENLPVQNPTSSQTTLLKLASELKLADLPLESTPFEQNGVITASISGTKVLFSTRKDLKKAIKALQLIKAKLKMDSVKPSEIDLRFDKVVVRY